MRRLRPRLDRRRGLVRGYGDREPAAERHLPVQRVHRARLPQAPRLGQRSGGQGGSSVLGRRPARIGPVSLLSCLPGEGYDRLHPRAAGGPGRRGRTGGRRGPQQRALLAVRLLRSRAAKRSAWSSLSLLLSSRALCVGAFDGMTLCTGSASAQPPNFRYPAMCVLSPTRMLRRAGVGRRRRWLPFATARLAW